MCVLMYMHEQQNTYISCCIYVRERVHIRMTDQLHTVVPYLCFVIDCAVWTLSGRCLSGPCLSKPCLSVC